MRNLFIAVVALVAAFQLMAAGPEWMTDLEAAKSKAAKEKKLVFLEFTGSDWCAPCKSLKKNVLDSKEFADFAQKNLVLVELDFPRTKPQPPALKAANAKLSEKFKVEGFPTVIVLDSQGKELHREVGYAAKSASDYVAALAKLKKT